MERVKRTNKQAKGAFYGCIRCFTARRPLSVRGRYNWFRARKLKIIAAEDQLLTLIQFGPVDKDIKIKLTNDIYCFIQSNHKIFKIISAVYKCFSWTNLSDRAKCWWEQKRRFHSRIAFLNRGVSFGQH